MKYSVRESKIDDTHCVDSLVIETKTQDDSIEAIMIVEESVFVTTNEATCDNEETS